MSGMASGGGRWGGYDGALDGEPRQEEGDDLEAFDLQYYDGLGRQDEVRRIFDPRTLNGINCIQLYKTFLMAKDTAAATHTGSTALFGFPVGRCHVVAEYKSIA